MRLVNGLVNETPVRQLAILIPHPEQVWAALVGTAPLSALLCLRMPAGRVALELFGQNRDT